MLRKLSETKIGRRRREIPKKTGMEQVKKIAERRGMWN